MKVKKMIPGFLFIIVLTGITILLADGCKKHQSINTSREIDNQPEIKPAISYLSNVDKLEPDLDISGDARILTLNGRSGINVTSMKSRIKFLKHNLSEKKGSFSLWVCSLEDIGTYTRKSCMRESNPHYDIYPLLSDFKDPQNDREATFSLTFGLDWYPKILLKYFKGSLYPEGLIPPQQAFVSANHFSIHRNKWYQFTHTWDDAKEELRLYANGILIGKEDQFWDSYGSSYIRPVFADTLYTGNPTLIYSEINFYDRALSEKEVYELYKENVTDFDQQYEDELISTQNSKVEDLMPFNWQPTSEWTKKLSLSLQEKKHLDEFYVQGDSKYVSITGDGMLMETPFIPFYSANTDKQVYAWTNKFFEGDIYVKFEFNILEPNGLALIMVQASGMNREDFMKDYPLKTSGEMKTVCWDDVRNYHWEFYREMNPTRNYGSTALLAKNPYLAPLAFHFVDEQLEKNSWHTLEFLQRGENIVGAIDGKILFDVDDTSSTTSGTIFNAGHFAFRCMIHTKMLFRNLRILNRFNEYGIREIEK